MRSGQPFPLNAHSVFETYIEHRLMRDTARLEQRFKVDIAQIRQAAERIAFCIAADSALGLNPTRESLREALEQHNMALGRKFDVLLDALEFIKLARTEESMHAIQSQTFTFAHRRFQEYFATSVVLREPSLVSPQQLLTNANWRETAVVMCQTQPIDKLQFFLEEVARTLSHYCDSVSGLIDDPLSHIKQEEYLDKPPLGENFPWPVGLHHILGLLQDGFVSRLADLPDQIRIAAGKLLLTATEQRMLDDRKYALEISGIVPEPILAYLLRAAFVSKSQWLNRQSKRGVGAAAQRASREASKA